VKARHPVENILNETPEQSELQVKSMTSENGLLHIELPGGLMLTGPCLLAPLPAGAPKPRLRADRVPDHFWMMGGDEGNLQQAGA
jgi:hypothetical protein